MSHEQNTFVAVGDQCLATAINDAQQRVVFAAPGLSKLTADALAKAIVRLSSTVTVILDADAEACRIGYGDGEALQKLCETAKRQNLPLRKQAGLRIGVLVADDSVLIWSPTARSVEAERGQEQPNGLLLGPSVVDICLTAMGADATSELLSKADIGRDPLTMDEICRTVEDLRRNPPAPFDLARRTRVFSSHFQFVEFEIRGAQWTERRINLSSVLLNADLPESLRDLLDTQIRPYQEKEETAFDVPHLVRGIPAFDAQGNRILVPTTQSQLLKCWAEIRDRYLKQLPGFGWLIKRDELKPFREATSAFEETLCAWVDAFRKEASGKEDSLVNDIVVAIKARVSRSDQRENLKKLDLDAEVRKGLARMRVVEPHVRIVLKDVAWESTRDAEFQKALEQALPDKDREGWFEEFTAARERTQDGAES
jgi:hypothetical protein